jgi:glycosyltransferase involved in cell wall biosynthesis
VQVKTRILEIGTGYTSIPAKVGAATEIVVEELARSSIKKGIDVVIFDISDKNRLPSSLPIEEVYLPSFISGKVGYSLGIFHKIKRVWYSISLTFRLNRYIKKDRYYILHFHNQYNFFFFYLFSTAKKRKNVRLYYTNHTYTWSLPWNDIKNLVKKKYFMENYSMEKSDLVFVLNENTVNNLTAHTKINASRIRLIPNGVNTDVYTKLPENDESIMALRKELHLENKKIFFHAGTVCERKNQLEIIKYLTPIFKSNPETIMVYAGGIRENDYFTAINNYCKESQIENNILYAGELPPGKLLNTYYNMAEAFIFFSKSEGFSLALLEALSSGLPVLLSKNLEIDFVKEKDNGILIFEDHVEFLSLLTKEILNPDRKQHHSGKAIEFINKNYSWCRVVDKYFPDIVYADHTVK